MIVGGRPYMTSDGRGEGGSAKSDFITKGSLIKHLMRGGGGGVKKGQNHLTSYMVGPLMIQQSTSMLIRQKLVPL